MKIQKLIATAGIFVVFGLFAVPRILQRLFQHTQSILKPTEVIPRRKARLNGICTS